MAPDHSLTRRTMLQVAGAGAIALSVPAAFATQASARAKVAPVHLQRSSYLGFTGARFRGPAGIELVLESVQDLGRAARDASLVDHEEAFALRFSAAAGTALPSGTHGVEHPELGPFVLFLTPVDRPGPRETYEVLVDRTVRFAEPLDAPTPSENELSPAAAAATSTATSTQAAARQQASRARAARERRLRVRTRAHRAHGKVIASLEFPGGGIQAVAVRLRRQGRTYARGETAIQRGRGSVTMSPLRTVPRGTYDFVITATDRRGVVTSVTRPVTIR